jgi:predicted PurR-regulated permease PerM
LLILLLSVLAIVGGSVNRFVSQAPHYAARVQAILDSSMEGLARIGVDIQSLKAGLALSPSEIMGFLVNNVKALGRSLAGLLTVLLILVAMLLEIPAIKPKLAKILPASSDVFERVAEVTAQVRRHFGVKTVVSLGTGVCVATTTALIGLDFPLVWGLVAYLLNYIPIVGSTVAAVPAVLLALVQSGIGMAALVAVAFLGVNALFDNFVEPPLMGRTLGLSTLAIFLSLLFWGWLWGIAGVLLSALLTMIVKIACERIPGLEWFAVVLGPAPSEDSAPTPQAGR